MINMNDNKGLMVSISGMSLEEYRQAVRALSCKLEPQKYPVVVDPSPKPLPRTSSGKLCPASVLYRLSQNYKVLESSVAA